MNAFVALHQALVTVGNRHAACSPLVQIAICSLNFCCSRDLLLLLLQLLNAELHNFLAWGIFEVQAAPVAMSTHAVMVAVTACCVQETLSSRSQSNCLRLACLTCLASMQLGQIQSRSTPSIQGF